MKLWVDDVRFPPDGSWRWVKSTYDAIYIIRTSLSSCGCFNGIISLDHDAGDFCELGGDYIKILDWIEMMYRTDFPNAFKNTKFHIHSANSVGISNMRRIINHNNWTEIAHLEN